MTSLGTPPAVTGGLADQFSAKSTPTQRSTPSALPRRARSRPLTQLEAEQSRLEALQAQKQWSRSLRLGFALTTLIWRIVAHMEARQRKFPYQSPSSNHASFWTAKAVFLRRLVAKTAKIFDPVGSGDMSGLYIGPGLLGNRYRDECQ
jgi:hypothetical protein